MDSKATEIAIVGAGIGGLALALGLHQRGIPSRIYEVAPELKELGVGITILPHAMRELTALGLKDKVVAAGVANTESAFFNRFGQLLYHEPRGTYAGYAYPEVGIHRGRLHTILYEAAQARLGVEQTHPRWPHLYTDRLDQDRQARDLSYCRQYRRRGNAASQFYRRGAALRQTEE
jgi:2-polyprenyl-6-methoxyphenol hydroxylase-like FAD-dependent oxidoreductase